jgi:quinol-cytochrome oxidoreductase complex cytochrome b subunit
MILENPAPFILLAILFGLQAQNIFLINRLLDNIKKNSLSVFEKNKSKRIISFLNCIIYSCFLTIAIILVRIITNMVSPQNEIIWCLDFIIVIAFIIICSIMFVTALISQFMREV